MIDDLLQSAGITLGDLDRMAVDVGPGSFTGLRIGVGVIQGLAYSCQLDIFPVSSLQAMAEAADSDSVISAIDARMGQLYWAKFKRNSDADMVLQGDYQVTSPLDPNLVCQIDGADSGQKPHLIGAGWRAYAQQLHEVIDSQLLLTDGLYPQAGVVARIACRSDQVIEALQLSPLYIRDQVVSSPSTKHLKG